MIGALLASASSGRVTLAKPTLTHHTVTGQFRITNYNALYTYTATATAGTATFSGDIMTMTNANAIATVSISYGKGLPGQTGTAERKSYTYTSGGQTCTPNCRAISGNCFQGTGSCEGDGSCGADGTICCGGSQGSTCTQNPDIKVNFTGSGYTDSYSEWWKVG